MRSWYRFTHHIRLVISVSPIFWNFFNYTRSYGTLQEYYLHSKQKNNLHLVTECCHCIISMADDDSENKIEILPFSQVLAENYTR